MARIWSMRFNLDTFNAAYAALDDDQEKAQFLTGFSRGLNAGILKDGQPDPMLVAYSLGANMREEAEAKSAEGALHAAKRGRNKGTQREPLGGPEGRAEVPSGEHGGDPEGSGLRIKDQRLPVQGFRDLDPTYEGEVPQDRVKRLQVRSTRKRTTQEPKPKLEAILGPKGSPDDAAYWKLVGIFGAAKNPAPTQTAQAFVNAMMTVPPHSILAKAQNLKDSLSGPQFMPGLKSWLDSEGYLNPDATTGKGPSHRGGSDAEYLAALDEGGISA